MKNPIPVFLFSASVLLSVPCRAAIVTTTADSGPGSLRDAISTAAPGETISFAVTNAITLTNGELVINKNLIIAGPGAAILAIERSTVFGTPAFRIFNIKSGIVTISGLTVRNGHDDGGVGGGALINSSSL